MYLKLNRGFKASMQAALIAFWTDFAISRVSLPLIKKSLAVFSDLVISPPQALFICFFVFCSLFKAIVLTTHSRGSLPHCAHSPMAIPISHPQC